MDLSAFSADEFDAKEWINNAWRASGSGDKEKFVSEAVMKLQLYTKQLTATLDDTTTQIVRGVPRILQEAQTLSVQGEALRGRLTELEARARDVEADTGHSIESLRRIDRLKSTLQAACAALQEADKWAQLANGLSEVLLEAVPTSDEGLAQLTEQVVQTTASLEMLSGSTDYESKRVQLEVLYNRLEAALSPAIVDAFTKKDAERASCYVGLLRAMDRAGAPGRYWRGVEAARIEADYRRDPTERSLSAEILEHAHSQIDWLTNVIRSPCPIADLVRVYCELLPTLEPSPTKLATRRLRMCGTAEEALNVLVDMRGTMAACVSAVRGLADGRESVPEEDMRELGRALHAPLRELLPEYTELQARALTDQLATIDCRQEDALDAARALQLCAERCETWARAAEDTGRKMAAAACYPYLLPALEALFAELCSRLSARHRLLDDQLSSSADIWRLLPATLATAAAAGQLLEKTRDVARHLSSKLELSKTDESSLEAESYLLTATARSQLDGMRAEPSTVLQGSVDDVARVCRSLRQLVLECLCATPARQLEKLPSLPVWSGNDALSASLPSFSLSPQEYATLVGQYLLTLPQHLEPLLTRRPELAAAVAPGRTDDLALCLLAEVCTKTCELYSEKVYAIRNMDVLGAKRCVTDIAYLSSVVEELGGTIPQALSNLETTLRGKAQMS